MRIATTAALALLVLSSPVLTAQAPAAARPAPAANPADVATLDSIVAAVYASISGAAGVERNWDRFRSLFAPGARLIPTGRRADGSRTMAVRTVEEYIETSGPALMRNGFFENEIARHTDRYGDIVQMFSTYESRRSLDDAAPFARGINSIQCRFDGTRWWVVTIFWEGESPAAPIPAEFLPPRR
jgi:hypothetical protein